MIGSGQLVLGQEQQCCTDPQQVSNDPPVFMRQQAQTGEYAGSCMKYVKVNVVFVLDGNGHGHYNETGNWDDNTNSFNTSGYTGTQFAIDLINRMNQILANNAPSNLCDGWAYYNNENYVELYNPNHPVPAQIPADFRLHLTSVNTLSQQNLYDAAIVADTDPPLPNFNNPNEIEIYCVPLGGARGSSITRTILPQYRGMAFLGGTRNGIPNTAFAALALHEIGHTLALGHNAWYKPTCTALAACPDSDEACKELARKNCYEHPYWLPNYTCNTAVDANLCNYTSTDQTFVTHLDDTPGSNNGTPKNSNCGAGLFPDHPTNNPDYWLFPYCDQPEEISNNLMDYVTSVPIPLGFAESQLCGIKNLLQLNGIGKNYVIGGGASLMPPQNLFSYNFNGTDLANWIQEGTTEEWVAQQNPNNCSYAGVAHVESTNLSKKLKYESTISIPANAISMSVATHYCFSATQNNSELNLSIRYNGTSTTVSITDWTSGYNIPIDVESLVGQNITINYYVNYGGIADIEDVVISVQTEDQITVPCNQALSLQTACVSDNGATINWSAPNDYVKMNGDYIIRYKPTSGTEWTEINVARSPFNNSQIGAILPTQQYATLPNLVPCTQYETQVKTVCNTCLCITEPAQYSDYTPSLVFTTTGTSCNNGATIPVLPEIVSSSGIDICVGSSTTLTTVPIGSAYQWSNNTTGASITVNKSGTYTVTVTTSGGCTATDDIQINVNKPAYTLGSNHFICPNTPINYTISPNNNVGNYMWSTGATTQSINVTSIGTYGLTVTDANGCTATDNVIVDYKEGPNVNLGDNITACNNVGLPATLNAGNTNCSYLWSTGVDVPSITANTGNYTVTVTAYNGCTSTDAISISNSTINTPTINSTPNICNVTLAASGGFGISFLWSTGQTSQQIHPFIPNTYTVTVTNTNGCTATASTTVTTIPQITTTITPTLNNCTVTLTAAGGSTYAWSTTESTPSIEVTTPNTYTVTVTNTNGCTATAQYTVDATQIATIANFSGDYTVGAMANPLGVYATNTETWNNPSGLRIAGQIIIPNGKHLIIDQTTLEMIGHDSRITVQKGGKMTITNQAVLRGNACTNDYWKGIRVLGDGTGHTGNIPQVNFNTGHYGWLRVFNGSTIQDAQIGIANTDDDLSTANAGGIISCTASNLIDNGQGVFLIPVKKYNNCSIITDNQFSFTKTYNYPYLSGSLTQQIGMVAVLTRFSNNLQNNRFVNTTNNNIIDLGTGYVLLSCRANIGGSGLYDGITEFSNLFKGIDAYNLWALEDQIKVHDNDFEQVHKGVSLNNGVFSGVFNNSFTNIQNGDNTGPGTAYGVYARNTYGIQIANNNFACSAPNNNGLQNIGVVLDNTGSYQNTLVNNSFSGNFGRATTFINTNKNVLADCNLYALNNNIDWYINGFLNDQGVCIVPTPELARRNSFHQYLPGINYYNISRVFDGTWFNYVGQVGFNPQFVAGGVSVDNTCPATEAVSHCTLNPDNCDPDCLLAQIDEATDNEKLIELYSYLLRQRIDLNQIEWGKLDLSRENRIDAQKVLIATLESQDSTEIALQKLADLPVESPDDAAFKTLYYQLLTGITPPAGSGKAMPAQEQLLRNTANTNNTANAAMAQSIVATYYHQTFNKNVPAVELTANNIATSVYLTIFPNPTSNEITVSTKDFLLPAELLITDLYGKTVKRVPITNNNTTINGFGTGIYFCNLVKDNAVISTQKFVVIR